MKDMVSLRTPPGPRQVCSTCSISYPFLSRSSQFFVDQVTSHYVGTLSDGFKGVTIDTIVEGDGKNYPKTRIFYRTPFFGDPYYLS